MQALRSGPMARLVHELQGEASATFSELQHINDQLSLLLTGGGASTLAEGIAFLQSTAANVATAAAKFSEHPGRLRHIQKQLEALFFSSTPEVNLHRQDASQVLTPKMFGVLQETQRSFVPHILRSVDRSTMRLFHVLGLVQCAVVSSAEETSELGKAIKTYNEVDR